MVRGYNSLIRSDSDFCAFPANQVSDLANYFGQGTQHPFAHNWLVAVFAPGFGDPWCKGEVGLRKAGNGNRTRMFSFPLLANESILK